jgi:hypothetical protein
MMRALFGIGTPRSLQGALQALLTLLVSLWQRLFARQSPPEPSGHRFTLRRPFGLYMTYMMS